MPAWLVTVAVAALAVVTVALLARRAAREVAPAVRALGDLRARLVPVTAALQDETARLRSRRARLAAPATDHGPTDLPG